MGQYLGSPQVEFLDDGRLLKLLNEYGYVDDKQRKWIAPQGAIVDGASIPRPLWTIVGGPLEGGYRNASILHDWYCDVRTHPWRDVHHMFFEAMLASSVPRMKAQAMYLAVYYGGPRWMDKTSLNTKLAESIKAASVGPDGTMRGFAVKTRSLRSASAGAAGSDAVADAPDLPIAVTKEIDEAEFALLLRMAETGEHDVDEIDQLVDERIDHLVR